MISEGCEKYPNGLFKVPSPYNWLVIVSGRERIEDLRSAEEEELSFKDEINELLQIEYTLGHHIASNSHHVATVRSTLTRNLGFLFPDVFDEIVAAFEDMIPARNEWIKIPALHTIVRIISRASNRLFVGLPLCRDPDYVDSVIDFTVKAVKTGFLINSFPPFLHPLVGRLVSDVPGYVKRVLRHLGPIIEDRLKREQQQGKDYSQKPNDLIQWLLDEAEGESRSAYHITMRVLAVNFAAIHTTAITFTHVLYDLAAHPKYSEPLRLEAERVVGELGWTKAALEKMQKVDSFARESQRMYGIRIITMGRKARKDFTFSNGITVPAGTHIAAASFYTHHHEEKYPDPYTFRPFRFSDWRQVESESVKYQAVNTSSDFIAFGHGRHACPGRFFAIAKLKAMLAHIVTTYDVKFEKERVRPPNFAFNARVIPNTSAEVMFRKRRM